MPLKDLAGEKDFTKSNPEEVRGSTMFCEGLIGKVRYAGLAYMLDEEGTIKLEDKAGEFFASDKEVAEQKASPVIEKYRDLESGKLDRRKMIDSEMSRVATQIIAKELVENAVTFALSSVSNIPVVETGQKGR
jgi:hypothetical protein